MSMRPETYPRGVCGIGGTVGRQPDPALLERMAETMVKRGPDGQGVWTDDRAGLAATRLAIIDLHERSNQPLHFGPLHLAFNGEIYNYRELKEELRKLGHSFETEGDAEVLLHAWAEWGESALERFNGMFAFAIWDADRGALTLACDPFGEKPLYFARVDGGLAFASEAKALDVPLRADEGALARYIARGVMPVPPASFFEGVERLPGSHVLRWTEDGVELRRYWQPQPVEAPAVYEDAVAELRALLLDSIRLRLRSDVPVGTSLSGGIDSSCVVMLSAELAGDHRRHAFTARFPGYERDEWRYAHEVAEKAGVVEHHAIEPTAEQAVADLEQLVLDHEEPVASLSVYAQWRVMAAAREAGVTVLLDGQGGDELFGGYPIASGFAVRSQGVGAAVREAASGPGRAVTVAKSIAVDHLPGPARRAYFRLSASPYAELDFEDGDRSDDDRGLDPLRRELMRESFETSLPELLRYADRSSMAHSREVRLPFLDRRIAELAFSLPPQFLYENGTTKRIVRDAGRGLVPDEILARRDKVGYEPPQRQWLEHPAFRELVADVLLSGRGPYRRDEIERDLEGSTWRSPAGLWRALNAELWLRTLVAAPS
jgi:asparagine synthase (glutamine-hydrolysing)